MILDKKLLKLLKEIRDFSEEEKKRPVDINNQGEEEEEEINFRLKESGRKKEFLGSYNYNNI